MFFDGIVSFRIRSATFPRPFFQFVTHSALGIVNDVVCNFVPVLVGFQLFEAEFENDLLVAGQLHPFDEADQ